MGSCVLYVLQRITSCQACSRPTKQPAPCPPQLLLDPASPIPPTQTDLSVVPSSTAPIQPESPQVHPIALPFDDALIASINPLQDDNWLVWKTRVSIVLARRGLLHLVTGAEPQPTTDASEEDATPSSWHVRDLVAQELLVCTMSDRQLVHVFGCRTAAAMWHALVTVHAPETWYPPARLALERRLYTTTCADEDVDVPRHLTEMITSPLKPQDRATPLFRCQTKLKNIHIYVELELNGSFINMFCLVIHPLLKCGFIVKVYNPLV
ncbi:hypothetical protein L210DRAFT_3100416 [Boletus edulis BED1]|uniref:Retrotransposon Copia-like N-terminal domain-containing protein n=1 Tax=Boletus edulis BED1 TaxID=1328754 RepID=A0AAD4BYU9_BOLED|nr:hypothetical protein L210DRAFT_3100416 [Boletus edulis BED1]